MGEEKNSKISRRAALSSLAKTAIGVVVAGVVGGVIGYGVGSSTVPKEVTTTVREVVTSTVKTTEYATVTVTAAPITVTAPTTVAAPTIVVNPQRFKGVTIDWWDGLGGGDGYVMDMLLQDWHKQYADNIKVIRVMQGEWSEVYSKIAAAYKAGTGIPDVCLCHSTEHGLFSGTAFQPIDDLVAEAGFKKEHFVEFAWNSGFWKGKQYGMPWDVHLYSLYINRGMANKYGIRIPELGEFKTPWDLIEWLREARQKLPPNLYPYNLMTGIIGWAWEWWTIVKGNPLTKEDLYTPDFRVDSRDGIESFEWYYTLGKEKLAKAHTFEETAAALGGDCLSWLHGPWMQATFDKIEGFDYVVVPVFGQGSGYAVWGESHMIYLTRANGDERTRAAWEVIKWLYKPENNGRWGAIAGHIPALKAGQEYPDYKNNPKRLIWAKQVELGFKHPPVHPDQQKWLNMMATYAGECFEGKRKPEDAASAAQADLEELAKYY